MSSIRRIAYQCNNPNTGVPGIYSDQISITVFDETDVELSGRKIVTYCVASVLHLGRLRIPIIGFHPGFGNWAWNAAWCSQADTAKIFNYLMHLKQWHCDEGPDALVDAFNSRRPITSEEI